MLPSGLSVAADPPTKTTTKLTSSCGSCLEKDLSKDACAAVKYSNLLDWETNSLQKWTTMPTTSMLFPIKICQRVKSQILFLSKKPTLTMSLPCSNNLKTLSSHSLVPMNMIEFWLTQHTECNVKLKQNSKPKSMSWLWKTTKTKKFRTLLGENPSVKLLMKIWSPQKSFWEDWIDSSEN